MSSAVFTMWIMGCVYWPGTTQGWLPDDGPWALHRVGDHGHYTEWGTMGITQSGGPWALHRVGDHGHYTEWGTMGITQSGGGGGTFG